MKKLGLRALASGLALLMLAGLSAPATAKAQDNVLLIAPAPAKELKILEITKDMVDEDGEIVISGGEYDRVVISRDVDAKDIYFDQVVVKEMVVESGSKTNVQLWEVDAEKLTVQEPEIAEFPIKELLPLLADDATKQAVIEMYKAHQADVAVALKNTPSIVTKEDAKVDELVARANVKLDLGAGEVSVVALEASDKIDRATVTLSNYEGNVTYKGTDMFNAMTLKNVDSNLKSLKVEESNANNYFTVTSKNSTVLKAEVSGNANVSFNAPMGEIEITEVATAANVTVLKEAKELKVAANGANVELAPNSKVTMATVTSDNVKITGTGSLGEADLQGKGAYVSIYGTKVEGENTYVPPTPPEKPKVVITDIDLEAGDGATVTKNANGSATVSYSGQYNKAYFNVPDSVDVNRISAVTMNITADCGFGLKIHTDKGVDITNNGWFPTGKGEAADYSKVVDPAKHKVVKLEFMSTVAGTALTVNSITFELLDKAPEVEPEEERPLVMENKVVTFDASKLSKYSYNQPISYSVNNSGALTLKTNGAYQCVLFTLPEVLNAADYPKLAVDLSSTSGEVAVKVWRKDEAGNNGNPLLCEFNAVKNPIIDLSLIAGDDIDRIEIAAIGSGNVTITVNKLTFVGSGNLDCDLSGSIGGSGSGDGEPDDEPSTPEEPEVVLPKYSDSFDSSVGAFTAMWGAPMEFDATEGHDAAGCVKVSAGEYGAVVNVNLASALPEGITLAEQDGKKLTASVWVKTEEAGGFKLALKPDGNTDIDKYLGDLAADQWAKIEFVLEEFEYSNDNAIFYIQDYANHEHKVFYVDDFEFEFTATATSEPSTPEEDSTPEVVLPKYSDSFDSSVGAFTAMWGAPMEFDATEGHDAAGCVKVSAGEYGAVVNVNLASALPEGITLAEQDGKKLTASVWVKTEEAGGFKLALKPDGNTDIDKYLGDLAADQWAKIEFVLEEFEYSNDNAIFYIQDYANHEHKVFYVDDFEFEFTATATSEPSTPEEDPTPEVVLPKYSDSFDSSVGAFTAMWGAPMEFDATEGHDAAGCVKVSAGEYGAVVNVNLASALPEGITLAEQDGKKLTASVWVKTEEAGGFKLALKPDGNTDIDKYLGDLAADQWAKIEFVLEEFEYSNDNAIFYIQDYANHEHKVFYVDDFEFEFTEVSE